MTDARKERRDTALTATTARYGRARVTKIKAAYDELRAACRDEGTERVQTAIDRYEPWADYVFSATQGVESAELADTVRLAEVAAAAYEAAASRCDSLAPAPAGGSTSHTNTARVMAFDCGSAVRKLTPADAMATLEARDKRVRAEAYEAAADAAEDYCSDMPDLAGLGHSAGIRDAIRALPAALAETTDLRERVAELEAALMIIRDKRNACFRAADCQAVASTALGSHPSLEHKIGAKR